MGLYYTSPKRSIEEIANEVFAKHGGNIEQIRAGHQRNSASGSRSQETVWRLSLICAKAHSEGWGYSAIGRYVYRGHDVVMHHCKRMNNA